MIQRDDRRGFGEAVALDHDEPEPAPERLEIGIERRRADDHRPELEAEHPVDAAVFPPAPRPVHRRGALGSFGRDASTCSFSTSRIFGTQTSTEIRRLADLPDDVFGRVAAGEDDHARAASAG